jgi:transcriptional regulator with XRE-family HTH domain
MEKILGQALKKEREMRGLSLAEIANETRIGTRYLEALENEDFSMFSGSFYIRYYIKNYLRACGADESAFFNTNFNYLQAILDKKGELPPDQYLNKLEYVKFKRRKTILLVLLLVLFAFLIYWFFIRLAPLKKIAAHFDFPAFSAAMLSAEKHFIRDWAPVAMRVTLSDSCRLQFRSGNAKMMKKVFVNGLERPSWRAAGSGTELFLSPDKSYKTMHS